MRHAAIACAAFSALALTACADPAPQPAPTVQQVEVKVGTSSPITALDAYTFCRALITSRLGFDRSLSDSIDTFGAADITAVDGTFEVGLQGPSGRTFCVLTGTLGDPRLLYTGSSSGWADVKEATLAAHPGRVIDENTKGDKTAAVDSLLAWDICRVLRLAQQPADYIAGWTDFNASDVTKGRQGIEVYEKAFPAGASGSNPVDTSSFCVVDGTAAAPYPVIYREAGPGAQDPRDYYGANLAEQVEGSLR